MSARDRIVLAPGVALDGGCVVDRVRALRLPANPSALAVLACADGRTVAEVGAALERLGSGDGLREALAFCAELNRHLLVNVRSRRPRTLLLPVRTTVARAVLPAAAALTLLSLPAAVAVHAWTIAPVVGAGLVLHEFAHAAALGGIPHAGVRRGLRATVVHPRLAPLRALVAGAAGPLAPALVAPALARVAAPAALLLAVHALALTVLSPDGRAACGLR